jgi:hypothetical protein
LGLYRTVLGLDRIEESIAQRGEDQGRKGADDFATGLRSLFVLLAHRRVAAIESGGLLWVGFHDLRHFRATQSNPLRNIERIQRVEKLPWLSVVGKSANRKLLVIFAVGRTDCWISKPMLSLKTKRSKMQHSHVLEGVPSSCYENRTPIAPLCLNDETC